MSTAFSPSVPTTTGRSMAVPFTFSCARSTTLSTSLGRAVIVADHTIQLDAWASPPFRSDARTARLSPMRKVPRLSGAQLRIARIAAETPASSVLVRNFLKRTLGVEKLAEIPETLRADLPLHGP